MWLAGKEQTAIVAFIPDRLVVLYSTHRPKFPWEKIGGGKIYNITPAGIYDLRVYIYIEDNLLNTHHIRWCGCRIWVKIADPYPVPKGPFTYSPFPRISGTAI